MGVATIIFGAVVLAFDPSRWDAVIFTLPQQHGIHLHDVIGMALVIVGIALLLFSPHAGSART
jgi:hypothetical protein